MAFRSNFCCVKAFLVEVLCNNDHVSLRVYLLAVSRMASAFGEILATLAAVDTDLIEIYVGMFGA